MDAQGTLWAGTSTGLYRFEEGRFANANAISKSGQKGVLALAGGRSVRLFVSTDEPGLYYMRDSSLVNYPLDVIHGVDCYYLDHVRHAAWMGTLGSGLLRWENGKLAHIRVKDGLYDNRIYSILKDDSSNFWMASSMGIFRVSQRELDDFADEKIRSVSSIPFSTGQLRFECESGVQPAACRTRDGRLWFSTKNGLVVVNPNRLLRNNIPPPVQITGVVVNGQLMNAARNLQLNPFERNVEIRYSGLSFVSPEKVAFRYMLGGYDKTWTDAGARREAFFTNLSPGTSGSRSSPGMRMESGAKSLLLLHLQLSSLVSAGLVFSAARFHVAPRGGGIPDANRSSEAQIRSGSRGAYPNRA